MSRHIQRGLHARGSNSRNAGASAGPKPRKIIVRRDALAGSALLLLMAASATTARAQSLPVGGTVASGGATIASNGTVTTVTQSTGRAVVDWTSFDIAANHGVVFVQPNASAATLNRVTGTTGSTIAGSLRSNGAVYLVNPNGIAITATGSVKTAGGFVASTLDISDADFNAGRLNFTGEGASKAVGNAGTISTGSGAYVALLGGSVSNAGTISVPLGKVGLGSGEQATLDLSGDGFMQVAVPSAGTGTAVDMTGQITAAGGRVELKAASVRDAVRNVVNLSGTVSVDNAVGDGGAIVLLGGDGGKVTVSGTLSARATGASGNGGSIETSGRHVRLTGLKADSSAAHGRTGTWLIDPTDLTVDAAAAVAISTNLATSNVTLKTDGTTASGAGTQSPGNGDITIGGAITWSSANTLELDAYNNINLNAAITGTAGGLTLVAGNAVANRGAISATGSVNVGTFKLNNGAWTQNGASLPGFAATDFQIATANASFLRVTGGNGSSGTPYQIADVYGLQGMASSTLLASNFTLASKVDASGTSGWNGGAGFVPIGTDGAGNVWTGTAFSSSGTTGFSGSLNGASHAISGLTINRLTANNVGLVGYSTGSVTYVTVGGGNILGRANVGGVMGSSVSGVIDHDISSANITASNGGAGGLVGYSLVAITNSSASGNVYGQLFAGGLVAYAGADVSGSRASGAVSGQSVIGGLVGYAATNIVNSSAAGSVTATADTAGGLAGEAIGAVSGSTASGAVSGISKIGGLIGLLGSAGSITQSSASGDVTATTDIGGGLVGLSNGTISRAFATGSVSGTSDLGGLVGSQALGSIAKSYATGSVHGTGNALGGLVGNAGNTSLNDVYATGSVSGTSGARSYFGGLLGASNSDTISNAYASGAVSGVAGTSALGGFIGSSISDTISASYYDAYSTRMGTTASGSGTLAGVSTVTSDPAHSADANYAFSTSAYANFTAADWIFFNGQTRPFGAWEAVAPGGTITNSHQLQLIGRGDTAALSGSYTLGNDIDLSETGANHGTASTSGGMWAATGWVPIGTDGAGNIWNGSSFTVSGFIGFSGALNGNSDPIRNLTINRSTGATGLFGEASGNASLSNITLTGVSIVGGASTGAILGQENSGSGSTLVSLSNDSASGTVSGTSSVGGLAGYFSVGSIINSHANVNVTATSNGVGGLAGFSDHGTLLNDYATGNVTATGTGAGNVGGLIGVAGGSVTNSYASGNVIGGASFVGGLIGQAAGSVSVSYASGNVRGYDYVGGLAGSGGPISSSYATGTVTALSSTDPYAGGLVGQAAGAISLSYATGAVTAAGGHAGGLIGYSSSSATVVTQSYATGSVSATGGYAGGLIGGLSAGTIGVTNYWDSYSTGVSSAYGVKTGGTVAATPVTSDPTQAGAANYAYKASAYGNFTASQWVFFDGQTRPFGAWEVPASGSAIVNSHELQLIGANAASESGSYSLGANINLAETGANHGTAATSAGMWSSAGFVPIGTDGKGNSWDGTSYKLIANISSGIYGFTGSLDGAGYTLSNLWISRSGVKNVGLFGVASGTLSNLKVAGSVTGGNGAGGLVGMLHGGSVSGSSSAVNVSGATLVGGLVGNQMAGTTITLSSATGTVTGTDDIGGLVGYANGAISLSYATGAASGSHYVGGLVGYAYQDGIANSYATGNATASINSAGGLIGKADTVSVSDSYSIGRVTAPVNAGGMIGQSFGSTIAASYWNTTTSGQSASAGGTGAPTSQLQNASTFIGWDFTNNWKISSGYPTLIRNP